MKTNITILSGLNDYKKKIAKLLSNKLDMFYVDVNELMEFNLVNISKAIKSAGKDYVEMLEAKTLKTVAGYTNSVITLDFSSINNSNSLELIEKSSLIIYLKLDIKNYLKLFKKQKGCNINLLQLEEKLFDDRDKILTKISDVVVKCSCIKQKDVINEILNGINNYYS